MPNRSYQAGVRLEYEIMKLLKANLPSDKTIVLVEYIQPRGLNETQ